MAESMHAEADAAGRDPLDGDPRVEAYFGTRFPAVNAYAALLADQGVLRGLIGPREPQRLWERHVLNSAAVVPFLPAGPLVDVGSGAGLPGMVIAAMQPDRPVVLVEPMERRCAWLLEVAGELGLENVTVRRARIEELGDLAAMAITARAVAPVGTLVKWCAPSLAEGGAMHFLKGQSAGDEIEAAKYTLRKLGLAARVLLAESLPGLEPTRVVAVARAG